MPLLVLINVGSQGLYGLLAPLTQELQADFGLEEQSISEIQALFLLVFAAATPLWAFAAAHWPRRGLLIVASLLWGGCCGLASFATDPILFSTLFVAAGIGNAAIIPVTCSMAVDVVPPQRRGTAFGWLFTGQTISLGAAFVIGGMLGDHEGLWWRLPFRIFAVFGGLAAVLLAGIRRPEPGCGAMESELQDLFREGRTYDLRIRVGDLRSLLRPVSNLCLVLFGVLFSASTGAVSFWIIGMLRQEHGFSAESATGLTIVLFVSQVPGAIIMGRLADRASLVWRHARLWLLVSAALLTLPCYFVGFLIPWTQPTLTSPGFVCFLGLILAGAFVSCALPPLTFNAVNEINPPEKRGVMFAMISISQLLGRALGVRTVALVAASSAAGTLGAGIAWSALLLLPAAVCVIPVLLHAERDRAAVHRHLSTSDGRDSLSAA